MIKARLAQLERAAMELGAGRCDACLAPVIAWDAKDAPPEPVHCPRCGNERKVIAIQWE